VNPVNKQHRTFDRGIKDPARRNAKLAEEIATRSTWWIMRIVRREDDLGYVIHYVDLQDSPQPPQP